MLNLRELNLRLSPASRYALAVGIFLAALLLRFWMFPPESGFQFITFYPAMVAVFYFCGIGPGALVAVLSSIAGYLFFTLPFWTLTPTKEEMIAMGIFLFSAYLIGWIVHQLQIHAQHSQDLFEKSFTGMVAIDPGTGRVMQANHIAQEMWGYDAEEFLTKTIADITYFEDLQESNQRNELLAQGMVENLRFEKRYLRKDGSFFWGESCVSMTKNDSGKVDQFIGNTIDISERKKIDHALLIENEKNRALLRNASDGIHILDGDGKYHRGQ